MKSKMSNVAEKHEGTNVNPATKGHTIMGVRVQMRNSGSNQSPQVPEKQKLPRFARPLLRL